MMSAVRRQVSDPVLELAGIRLRFGGVVSLDGVSLTQQRGEILAVIGPNGAGKTSLFNCIAGAYVPQEGQVLFRDGPSAAPVDVRGKPSSRIARLGIARTFQNIRLFDGLSAVENVQVGAEAARRPSALAAVLGLPSARRADTAARSAAVDLLESVGLGARRDMPSAALSYGEQRRLEIARALATRPSLLLLDEPAAGTNATERDELCDLITAVNRGDYPGASGPLSVLLIEHDIGLVAKVSQHIAVLNFGRLIAEGDPPSIRSDPAVVEAYLGAPDTEPIRRRSDRQETRHAP